MEPETVPMENLDLLPDEILLQIMLKMTDLKTLNNWCLTSYRAANLCRDKGFWKQKYQRDYPKISLLPNLSWKEKYEFIHSSRLSPPISAGFAHYAIIDDQGMLYIGGNNGYGQWGLGHQKNLGEFSTSSPFKQKVRSVSCGFKFTLAVTEDGDLYFWGVDFYKSLFPEGEQIYTKPKQIKIPGKAIKVSAGPKNWDESHVYFAVIMENGFVYFRYDVNFFDINPIDVIDSPNYNSNGYEMIETIIPIKTIDISVEYGFGLVSTEGKLLFFGKGIAMGPESVRGPDDYIGIKIVKDKVVIDPIMISLPEPIKQVCVDGVALSVTGNVYLWGYNTDEQLDQPQKLNFPDPIVFLSCQMDTISVISNNGKLYMWGDNKFGSIVSHDIAKKITGMVKREII